MSTDRKPRSAGARARGAAWAILLTAAALEVVWALALKEAGGVARPGMAAVGIGVAVVSLGLLSFALRVLPVGTAYAVWVGIGAVGVAVAGMLAFGEPADPARLFFLSLILAGVIGLSRTEGDGPKEGPSLESTDDRWYESKV